MLKGQDAVNVGTGLVVLGVVLAITNFSLQMAYGAGTDGIGGLQKKAIDARGERFALDSDKIEKHLLGDNDKVTVLGHAAYTFQVLGNCNIMAILCIAGILLILRK